MQSSRASPVGAICEDAKEDEVSDRERGGVRTALAKTTAINIAYDHYVGIVVDQWPVVHDSQVKLYSVIILRKYFSRCFLPSTEYGALYEYSTSADGS